MKKTLSLEKIIIYTIAVIAVTFAIQMITDYVNYSGAIEDIKNGCYAEAMPKFEKLEGFRDSEDLKVYCEIMSGYDPEDFVSVYHCYRGLSDIEDELDNKKLSENFTRTTTEVETLYKHYSIGLSVK